MNEDRECRLEIPEVNEKFNSSEFSGFGDVCGVIVLFKRVKGVENCGGWIFNAFFLCFLKKKCKFAMRPINDLL